MSLNNKRRGYQVPTPKTDPQQLVKSRAPTCFFEEPDDEEMPPAEEEEAKRPSVARLERFHFSVVVGSQGHLLVA